ncbi:MAG: hypothetical protein H8D43_02080 [Chloroflexi bacterium]|nr:hypothetical protein [Chloroflexota bacterium]
MEQTSKLNRAQHVQYFKDNRDTQEFYHLAAVWHLRMVRDEFPCLGLVTYHADGRLTQIVLDQAEPLAEGPGRGLRAFLIPLYIATVLGEI